MSPAIMQRLREATRGLHDELEGMPFFEALARGALHRESYVGWLRALHTLHETLEGELARATDPVVRAVFRDDERRAGLLERDLEALSRSRSRATERATERAELHAMLVAQELRFAARSAPLRLLGALYVLEGAALGGQVLRGQVEATFGVRGDEGLGYLSGRGRGTRAHFQEFAARMDAAVGDPPSMACVVDGAVDLFTALRPLIAALHPLTEPSAFWQVRAMNEEAGTHIVADDLRELDAALRAGEASWEAFPYYEARYGERGRRFTRSDSGWLVTLCRLGPSQVRSHVFWLGRVLASRGMPRRMLEEHLGGLHDALVAALPERAAQYQALLEAQRWLQDARVARLPGAEQAAIAGALDPGLAQRAGLPRIAELVVAAAADEADGLEKAVASLMAWAGDRERHGEDFVRAIEALLGTARAAFAKRPSPE